MLFHVKKVRDRIGFDFFAFAALEVGVLGLRSFVPGVSPFHVLSQTSQSLPDLSTLMAFVSYLLFLLNGFFNRSAFSLAIF